MELRNDIELRKAKIEIDYDRLKMHYLPNLSSSEGGGSWLSLIPSAIVPIASSLLSKKGFKSKSGVIASIAGILLALVRKK